MYGDTGAGRKRVAQVREQAADLRALADRLLAQSASVPWQGRAAEAMRARVEERAASLRADAARHETAAESLARHLSEVDSVKETIEARQHRAARLLADDDQGRPPASSPPPSGHKDWLTVELPGR